METWRGIEATPQNWPKSVVAIGVFDGVHRGHQALIRTTVAEAERRGDSASVVITFDPHPTAVVAPKHVPASLATVDRRIELIGECGADAVCVLPFTRELSQLSPEDFVKQVLVDRLHAEAVVVGEDFRFGHKAAGDTALLARLGAEWGFDVYPQTLEADTESFSSSRVRRLISSGDVEGAAEVLGRPYSISGTVVRGAGRGVDLGFPTANIGHDTHVAVPTDGIYSGWLHVDERRLPAAVSVGTNPTFGEAERTIEAYVLDFEEDLYNQRVRLDFAHHLRGQITFDNLDELVKQISDDVTQVRRLLEGE
ncbi:bifunctional riboflavin kinase/FAD synthetase [Haloglycomyces albus]|uniref:bifunctional riboflavin kinase/FAD synthetase n=1 Tax=Haloglycomyces albus TaxID=526067 RepID=UPI00046D214A|nr:bifunctional riboflavin kinase/FAD synthetase [Haloglycomyces albus]